MFRSRGSAVASLLPQVPSKDQAPVRTLPSEDWAGLGPPVSAVGGSGAASRSKELRRGFRVDLGSSPCSAGPLERVTRSLGGGIRATRFFRVGGPSKEVLEEAVGPEEPGSGPGTGTTGPAATGPGGAIGGAGGATGGAGGAVSSSGGT